MSRKTKDRTEEDEIRELQRLSAISRAGLEDHLALLKARRDALKPGSFDKDLAMAEASLQRALNGALGEARQQAKDALRRRQAVTEALVLEFFHSLAQERKEALLRELERDAEDRSVLG